MRYADIKSNDFEDKVVITLPRKRGLRVLIALWIFSLGALIGDCFLETKHERR